jgi:AcrR family transcriptional regulator
MTAPTDHPDRPLRRDAQRNLERIRAAATKVFRERGLDAPHEAIAREADVSVGTVYRRFPDREQLIDLLFEAELDAVAAVAEQAAAEEDPWQGVVHLFEGIMELSAENLGLKELVTGAGHGADRVARARDRIAPLATQVIERARAAGAIRPDAAPQDIPATLIMLGGLVDAGREHAPDLWRRHLALVLDGLRPEGRPRDPLPPTVGLDVIDQVVAASHRRR